MTRYMLLGLLLLASCAPSPIDIQAAVVAPGVYAGMSCDQIHAQQADIGSRLADLEVHQEAAHTTDVATGVLFLLPIASLTGGNHAAEISQLKGQDEALRQAALGCRA